MNRAAYIAALKAAGHFNAALVRKTAGGFYVTCECGYQSTHRTSERECIETIQHHRRKELAAIRANGGVSRTRKAAGL